MPIRDVDGDSRVAYRKPQPAEMAPDLLVSPVLPVRRTNLGTSGAERLVPAALPVGNTGLLGQSPEGDARRRTVPPSSYESCARLRAEGPLALPGARLGGGTRRVRV